MTDHIIEVEVAHFEEVVGPQWPRAEGLVEEVHRRMWGTYWHCSPLSMDVHSRMTKSRVFPLMPNIFLPEHAFGGTTPTTLPSLPWDLFSRVRCSR